ncbi:ribonuclease H-like domain-containing protein [Tanacetum coccineum]
MAVEDTPPPPPPSSSTDKIIPFSIPNKVPIKLDLEKHNYNAWSSFSLIHLGSLGLKAHVESKTASTNPEWEQLDDLVKMWILSSLCDSFQDQVVTTPGNAKKLWDHLKDLFYDNKDARIINLDNELRSIKIGKMTVNDYCTKNRSMADRHKNLRGDVSDKNLVLYTVNGLDSRFATLVEIIRHRETFPSFATTRNMLLLKESSFNESTDASTTFESSSSPNILMASTSSDTKGATSHLNYNAHNLSNLFNTRLYSSIHVSDGNSIPVTNIGHSIIHSLHRPLHLNNVLDFLTWYILLRCDSSGDHDPVTKPSILPVAFVSTSSTTWHQRLSHPRDEVLHSLSSRHFISYNEGKSTHVCHACQLGKHVKLPFHSSHSIVQHCFDIIHSDLWTSPIVSSSGFKYYVLFLDHFSHYVWIYPLKHKSDMFSKFFHFRNYVKNQFQQEIKSFQCDHGGEFDNNQLHTLFNNNGIQLRFSCPKISQQNGKAERMIRTINNVIRTLLFQAHLPPSFWVEALHMATYLLNLLPSKAINNEIPFTKLFNKEPNYSRLRIFGCLCYPHLHSPHKLAPRFTPCIFLGSPAYHRGYRCLNLETNKIILSRHVTFDENQFPYKSMTPSSPPSYQFLEPTPPPSILPHVTKITSPNNGPTPRSPTQPNTHTAPTPLAHLPRASHTTPLHNEPNPPTLNHTATSHLHTPAQHLDVTHQLSPPAQTTNTAYSSPTLNLTTTTAQQSSPPAQHSPIPTPTNTTTQLFLAEPAPACTHTMVTRSQSGIVKPLELLSLHTSSVSLIPKSTFLALKDQNWCNAMYDEYNALVQNGTWILVPRPTDANLVRSMWLFKHKFHADDTLSRYKARLVANGSSQQLGVDFDETFSPVVKPATIHTVLSLAVSRQWPIHQLDVKNAFLNDDLSETVYMHQPPGFVDSRYPNHAYLLQISLYGLKQAPYAWFQRIFLSQKKYALELLARAHMVKCNPSRTPVDSVAKLGPDGVPVQDPTLYRSLAWGLQYLTFTRPDLSYAVQQICLYMHDPREPYFAALKRILCYVQGTLELGLHLYASATTSLVGYTDADWAGCPSTRSSTSGYCVFLGDNHCPGMLNVNTPFPALVLKRNIGVLLIVVYMSANPVQHQRTKHIEIDIHFVRDMVKAGHVRVLHVPSRFLYADIFTKGLPSDTVKIAENGLGREEVPEKNDLVPVKKYPGNDFEVLTVPGRSIHPHKVATSFL